MLYCTVQYRSNSRMNAAKLPMIMVATKLRLPGLVLVQVLHVFFFCIFLCVFCVETTTSLTLPTPTTTTTPTSPINNNNNNGVAASKFVILGGTGKIGTAVAAHLSHRLSSASEAAGSASACEIVLVGRRPAAAAAENDNEDDDYFQGVLREIEELVLLSKNSNDNSNSNSNDSSLLQPKITYRCVPDIWEKGALDDILLGGRGKSSGSDDIPVSCVIHTAGPYSDQSSPTVLDACIDFKIPVYVDVSDPIDFLETSLERHQSAIASGTTAILAAGAFPGMSNVLAMEAAAAAAAKVTTESESENENEKISKSVETKVKDVRFNYFTKGLGGSGTVNLYITNLGFGDPMVMHENGKRTRFDDLSGRLLGKVDFFINNDNDGSDSDSDSGDSDSDDNLTWMEENARARARVGTQKVFAWPFPEAATVASELSIAGSSSSAMGTAPDVWNDMLGLLVDLVPRNWWRSRRFSKFMADFSEPLVVATDFAMRKLTSLSNGGGGGGGISVNDGGDCGETHAMRIDVVTELTTDETTTMATGKGTTATSTSTKTMMTSIVQCHDSFRRCVGQSCAEFALDALLFENEMEAKTGVYLPEQRYRESKDRARIIDKLTSTPGTFCYTGPVDVRPTTTAVDAEMEIEVPLDRIVLKNTPTPGLICNGSPVEIRLERIEEPRTPVSKGTTTDVDRSTKRLPKQQQQQQLPVYPTGVREIVKAMGNNNRLR